MLTWKQKGVQHSQHRAETTASEATRGIIISIYANLHDEAAQCTKYSGTRVWPNPYADIGEWDADIISRYTATDAYLGREYLVVLMHAEPFLESFAEFSDLQWEELVKHVYPYKDSIRMFAVVRNVPYARNYQQALSEARGTARFLNDLGDFETHPLVGAQPIKDDPNLYYLSDRSDPIRCMFQNSGKNTKAPVPMKHTEVNKYDEQRFAQHKRPPNWPVGWRYPRNPEWASLTEGEDAVARACHHCDKLAIHPSHIPGSTVAFSFDRSQVCGCVKSVKPWMLRPQLEIFQYPSYDNDHTSTNRGIRALQYILADTIIGEYNGTFIPVREEDTCGDNIFLFDFDGPPKDKYNGRDNLEWRQERSCILSAGIYGNWTRFLNSAQHDVDEEVNAQMAIDIFGRGLCVTIKTTRDIMFGEQILVYYGDKYFAVEDKSSGIGKSGSSNRRGIVKSTRKRGRSEVDEEVVNSAVRKSARTGTLKKRKSYADM